MRRLLPSLFAPVLSLALAAPALAQEITEYGTSGDWRILVDPAKGNGCFVEKDFPEGIKVQMGYWPSRTGGFFGAYSTDWADLLSEEEGMTSKVKFDFPDKRFVGESERHILTTPEGDIAGGFVFFDNPNVPDEIAKNIDMIIMTEHRGNIPISLAGTSNAIKSARECQGKQPE